VGIGFGRFGKLRVWVLFWGAGDWDGGKCRREVLIIVVKLWMVSFNMALICAVDWRTRLPLPVGVNTHFLFIRASFRRYWISDHPVCKGLMLPSASLFVTFGWLDFIWKYTQALTYLKEAHSLL
jgi:hypothetical protein